MTEGLLSASPAFGARLDAALRQRGPLCVGIDPHASLLSAWGYTDDVAGLERFAMQCAEGVAATAAVVKPQSAFFERFGSAGVAVLARTIAACRQQGALVLLDVKRGDIGSTMQAYAQAYLDPVSDLAADAITVSPYLGVGSLRPAFDLAQQRGAGVFVLAMTSNPEGRQIQHARSADGPTVAQTVADGVAELNAHADPFGPVGLVVGATIGASVPDLSRVNGPFLVPGIGAQGGTSDDVRRIFAGQLEAVLPSVSRGVLSKGPSVAGLRAASQRLSAEFAFLRN